jgi:hypothetical protein
MNRPATPTTSVADATRTFAPWVLFVALMLVGIACFFLFGVVAAGADRTLSLTPSPTAPLP